jgi:hypothetical protein
MFSGDHDPPHFHARCSGHHTRIGLDGEFLAGTLPRRARRLIEEWVDLHEGELAECRRRATRNEPPGTIDALP